MSKSFHHDDDDMFFEYGFKQRKMNPYNKDKDRRKSRILPREVLIDDEDEPSVQSPDVSDEQTDDTQ